MNEVTRVVVHPSNKNAKHDISLVVPCYDEWTWVLDTLYTAAIEAERSGCKIAVFLVVNNKANCNPDILEENKRTAKLAVDIMRWKQLWHKQQSGYYYGQRKKIERIRNSGITVWLVDCYTEKNAPEECNVWYARDVWTRSILDFLQNDNCIIAHTDADCRLERNYFRDLEEYYFAFRASIPTICWETDEDIERRKRERVIMMFQLEDVQITTWNTSYVFEKWEEETRKKIAWVERYERLIRIFLKGDNFDTWSDGKTTNYTPGSHHQYRRGIFKEVWWYKQIGWAEDVTFWMKAQQLWHTIHNISAHISTLCRPSERTVEWHGFWFEMIRKWQGVKEMVLTDTVDYLRTLWKVQEILQECHKSDDFRASMLDSGLIGIFSMQVIRELISTYEEYAWWEDMKEYDINGILTSLHSAVRNELRKIFPRKPLYEVVWEAMEAIDNDTLLSWIAEQLDVISLDVVKIELPKNETDEDVIRGLCKCASHKIYAYHLLKSALNYLGIFFLAYQEFQERYKDEEIDLKKYGFDSLDELYMEVVSFIIRYWQKIIANLLVEVTVWDDLDKVIERIEWMFEKWKIDEDYIKKIEDMDGALNELNEKYDGAFLNMWYYFSAEDFGKRYEIYE